VAPDSLSYVPFCGSCSYYFCPDSVKQPYGMKYERWSLKFNRQTDTTAVLIFYSDKEAIEIRNALCTGEGKWEYRVTKSGFYSDTLDGVIQELDSGRLERVVHSHLNKSDKKMVFTKRDKMPMEGIYVMRVEGSNFFNDGVDILYDGKSCYRVLDHKGKKPSFMSNLFKPAGDGKYVYGFYDSYINQDEFFPAEISDKMLRSKMSAYGQDFVHVYTRVQ
jgi:hypothetical protein